MPCRALWYLAVGLGAGQAAGFRAIIYLLLEFYCIGSSISCHAGLYGTFVIEERHGFNKQTLGLWVMDLVKQLALGAVILPPCVAAFTLILQHTSVAMVFYLWAFVFGLQLFFMTICKPPDVLLVWALGVRQIGP